MPIQPVNFALPSVTTLFSHTYCPFAQRAFLALELYDLDRDYKFEQVELYGGKKPKYLINRKVPVLVHDNQLITESEDILDYIHTHTTTGSIESPNIDTRNYYKNIINGKLNKSGREACLNRNEASMYSVLNEIEET